MAIISNVLSWLGFSNLSRMKGTQLPITQERAFTTAAPVTAQTALQLSAVWACVRLLAETVASLPMNIKKRNGKNWTDDEEHALYTLFAFKPNRYMTRLEWFECMMLNLVLQGNAYAKIERNSKGQIISLLPLMASQMQVVLAEDGGVIYAYNTGNDVIAYGEDNILHVKLFGNGIIGLSPLSYGAAAMGVGIAAEGRASKMFANGAKPTGVLMLDKTLTAPQREQIREQFAGLAAGDTDQLYVLEAAMKYEQVSMSPIDAQLLETRKFQIEDIARFFGVPSVLINHMVAGALGSNVAQIIEGFYKLNLRPYLERFEAALHAKLLAPGERRDYKFEMDYEALLRTDRDARFKTYATGVQNGIIDRDEARGWEGLPARGNGAEVLTAQTNLAPLGMLGKIQPGKTTDGSDSQSAVAQ